MDGDAWPGAVGRHTHFQSAEAPKFMERCGGAMTEDSAMPRGEHGCHPPTLSCEDPVADGIDAVVNRMQAAEAPAFLDRVRGNPGTEQLLSGDNAVLPVRKCRDHPIHPRPLGFAWHIQ